MRLKMIAALTGAAAALVAFSAQAATINWATWGVPTSPGFNGSVAATIGTTSLVYTGEVQSINAQPSWTPVSTFTGGPVSNAPPSFQAVQLFGGPNSGVNTITFTTPIVDPVLAIWSLGQPGMSTTFVFSDSFLLAGGGPNAEYGGQGLTSNLLTVSGTEGNGLVLFSGTFTTLSWTNPQFENWYGFTVGYASDAPSGTPIPGALPLFATGLGALGLIGWRRKRRPAAAA